MQSTCITPLDVEPSDFQEFLVVQGFITDDFGPHDLRITTIAKFAARESGTGLIVDDADVRIIDQDGGSVPVQRVSQIRREVLFGFLCGIDFVEIETDYRTPETFKGEIGSTYTLEIVTKEGKTYRSEPQIILPTPPIDSLSLVFKELPDLDQIVPESGVEIFASWQDPAKDENFYFWRVNGTYHIYTPDLSDDIRCCPYDLFDKGAKNCWIVENNLPENELAFSDSRVNGQNVTLPIGLIQDDGFRFGDKSFLPSDKLFHVEVEQYAISQGAFKFNEKAKLLGDISGQIFDPPPVSIRGNIFNINDPEETVVGYFGAYAKQTKGIFIPRSLLKFTQLFPGPCGDCRGRRGAQLEIPEPYK